ncbi:hypothetical protein AOLI_G00079260 [Acnodon oligacanthus]
MAAELNMMVGRPTHWAFPEQDTEMELRWHVQFTTPASLQAAATKAERAELILSMEALQQAIQSYMMENHEEEMTCSEGHERVEAEVAVTSRHAPSHQEQHT